MLTDDDLIRELETALRDDTAALRYTGKVPAPRTRVVPWTAVPIAAATAAVVVLPQLGGGPGVQYAGPQPTPSTSAPVAPAPSAAAPAPELVTETIELAGMSFRYSRPAGTPSPATNLYMGVRPPADATEVDLTGSPDADWVVRAWVGTEPRIGEAGLFVQTKSEGIGEYGFFTGEGVTAEDWERMIRTGSNR